MDTRCAGIKQDLRLVFVNTLGGSPSGRVLTQIAKVPGFKSLQAYFVLLIKDEISDCPLESNGFPEYIRFYKHNVCKHTEAPIS